MKPDYHDYIGTMNSLFAGLDDAEFNILKKNAVWRSVKKGELIFKEGDKPAGLICLADGKVKVFKTGIGDREQIIGMAKPTGFIGHRALFAEENHTTAAIALEDCVICIFNSESLYAVMKSNNSLSMQIIKSLAGELGFTYNRIVALTQKHIRGRLAEALIFLIYTFGFEDDGVTLKICLPRVDIANLSNMTTANAIRTLTAFVKDKIIDTQGRKIIILNILQLQQISEQG